MSVHDQLKETILKDYQRRIKLYHENKEIYQVVFAGDSLFGFMNIKKYFKDLKIHNQGIPGDTTVGLLNRIDEIILKQPEIVCISIGSNDLVLLDASIDDIVSRILKIYHQLLSMNPKLKVYVLTITPVLSGHAISNESYIANRKNEDIIKINQALKNHIGPTNIIDPYFDLATKNNTLNINYTTDGIHLNDLGYQIYSDHMKKKIESR